MAARPKAGRRTASTTIERNSDKGEQPPPPRLAMSIPEFCSAFRISEDFFYKLKRQGQTPRLMKVGARTLISFVAADKWRKQREREAATAIARKTLRSVTAASAGRGD